MDLVRDHFYVKGDNGFDLAEQLAYTIVNTQEARDSHIIMTAFRIATPPPT
jgi:hypothetical protein